MNYAIRRASYLEVFKSKVILRSVSDEESKNEILPLHRVYTDSEHSEEECVQGQDDSNFDSDDTIR